jgi:hypothetical protein
MYIPSKEKLDMQMLFRVNGEQLKAFMDKAKQQDRTASECLRFFIQEFLNDTMSHQTFRDEIKIKEQK